MLSELAPTAAPSPQTWAAIATALAGATAVFLKKRYNRTRSRSGPAPKPDLVTRSELHEALDSVNAKVDACHKEVLTALGNQSHIIEQRLDRLDVIAARLDERTK